MANIPGATGEAHSSSGPTSALSGVRVAEGAWDMRHQTRVQNSTTNQGVVTLNRIHEITLKCKKGFYINIEVEWQSSRCDVP